MWRHLPDQLQANVPENYTQFYEHTNKHCCQINNSRDLFFVSMFKTLFVLSFSSQGHLYAYPEKKSLNVGSPGC